MAAAGCSDPGDDSGTTGDEQDLTQINGQDPQAFFQQFLYRREARSNGTGYSHHHASTFTQRITLPSGLEVSLSLWLRADGRFTADYTELRRRSASELEHVHEQEVAGTWRVADATLVLDGLGTAEGLTVNARPALTLTLSRDVHEPGLASKKALVQLTTSSWGPDGND